MPCRVVRVEDTCPDKFRIYDGYSNYNVYLLLGTLCTETTYSCTHCTTDLQRSENHGFIHEEALAAVLSLIASEAPAPMVMY